MDNYSIVGKRIPHRDSVEKVKGSAIFTSDIKLNGMLYGKILRAGRFRIHHRIGQQADRGHNDMKHLAERDIC